MTSLRVLVETTPKKCFASALDWPGLSRGGRDEGAAIDALRGALPRYAVALAAGGVSFDADAAAVEVDVVERWDGDASTAFGVPAIVADADRAPCDAAEAARLAAIVEAAWATLERVAATAPEELRKGPRGGGRDTSKVVAHVQDAEQGYAGVMGVAAKGLDPATLRRALLEQIDRPSDGSPLAGKRWPPRYAARRIAWHALDHAWEIEDRSSPSPT
jgi:hypothetical protein